MQKNTVLIIEDESSIVEFLKIGLRYENIDVSSISTGKSSIDFIKSHKIDLIILDIMLPDLDGFEICKKVKSINPDIPIIMLTAKKDIEDKVKGLNSGADDYITKPFSFDELLARIKAVLRRYKKIDEKQEISIGDIRLNAQTRLVYVKNKQISLTPTEFSILEIFMKNPMRVFTRDALLDAVFGHYYAGNANIIDVHISNLRDKIGDKPPKLIKTIYGIGYAFYPNA